MKKALEGLSLYSLLIISYHNVVVDIYGQSRTFRAHLYDDGVFGDFYLKESLTVLAANGSRIGIQFVSYLLPCAFMDVTVTENEPLIRILHSFNDRSYLIFQTDKGVDFLVDGILQVHDFLKAPYKGGFRTAGSLHLFLPMTARIYCLLFHEAW